MTRAFGWGIIRSMTTTIINFYPIPGMLCGIGGCVFTRGHAEKRHTWELNAPPTYTR